MKKDLEANPPWRKKEIPKDKKYENAKLKATKEPGQDATMYVPSKPSSRKPKPPTSKSSQKNHNLELDSELRYTFQRNFQFLRKVFSPELLLRPLPDTMGHNIRRNLGFFTRVFTQFWDPKGVEDAQKSLGLGPEQRVRRVKE